MTNVDAHAANYSDLADDMDYTDPAVVERILTEHKMLKDELHFLKLELGAVPDISARVTSARHNAASEEAELLSGYLYVLESRAAVTGRQTGRTPYRYNTNTTTSHPNHNSNYPAHPSVVKRAKPLNSGAGEQTEAQILIVTRMRQKLEKARQKRTTLENLVKDMETDVRRLLSGLQQDSAKK
ncbi:hypothetical protein ADEAN_000034800 [Angomonas deanei]|uniref:Uncharacterized protein n=1 Tax=Angomonas deanei TaxID=59799 RepID=A0A7G2C4T9_9TRYP|nr:hypothetical protein ADEAN_000034800 [Angomonas deanei]